MPAPTPTPTPTTSPPDTTPPSAITGLIANNAYDKRVNLWWDKTTATDFDHYNIYLNKAEMVDITGMKPIQQIKDAATSRYQVPGLDDGTKYYMTVTAVDKSGNENARVASVSATPAPMPRGTTDPEFVVDVYQSDLTWGGTTLLADQHNRQKPRIIEVNMLGEIVWQYLVPDNLKSYTNPGFDTELLPNNNILSGISHINSQSSDYHPPSPLVRIIPACHAVVKHPPSPPGRLERSLIRGCHPKLLSRAPCELLILKKANTSPFVTPPTQIVRVPA